MPTTLNTRNSSTVASRAARRYPTAHRANTPTDERLDRTETCAIGDVEEYRDDSELAFGRHRRLVQTARLQLAPWTMSDVEAALSIFGDGEVARWLAPAMNPIPDMAAMQHLVSRWGADSATIEPPLGRWKVTDLAIGHTVGAVSLLPLPPDNIDFEIGVQVARGWWGNGYAGEVPRSLVARVAQWRPRTSHSSGIGIRPAPWRRAAR
ncbi:GNAT family N-acetyltransferase [Streptomyces sp. NPDC004074]